MRTSVHNVKIRIKKTEKISDKSFKAANLLAH